MQIIGTVQRYSGLSEGAFASLCSSQTKPFIVEGALDECQALSKWDPTYLCELLGETRVKCKYSPHGIHPNFFANEMKDMFAVREYSFAEYIERITHGPRDERAHFLFTGDEQFLYKVRDGKAELNPALAPLWNDVQIPLSIPQGKLYSAWSWFSAGGVKTWLHYDNNHCHNLNAQIRGKKRCLLFAPDQRPNLAMFPPEGSNPAHNCSQINVFDPNYDRFPQFKQAEAFEAELNEGEMLFLPDEWSHAFEHLGEFNANVNFWWLV